MFTDFTPQWNFYLQFSFIMFLMPMNALRNAAEMPMYMRLLPKERYGQFCSANEMTRSVFIIFMPAVFGFCIDVFYHGKFGLTPMGDWAYRLFPIWPILWLIPSILCFGYVYREWKRRGGDKGYTPPEAGYGASVQTAESNEKGQ